MIFVTIGTNDKRFDRLLQAVEKAVQNGEIKDRVIVQCGFTTYQSSCMECFDYLDRETFETYLKSADLIICHGGVGTIMSALADHRKILAAARLSEYGEHVNDHQTQILESFDELGYLIYMKDLSDIGPYLKKAETFEPKTYRSNTDNMISLIENWMEKN